MCWRIPKRVQLIAFRSDLLRLLLKIQTFVLSTCPTQTQQINSMRSGASSVGYSVVSLSPYVISQGLQLEQEFWSNLTEITILCLNITRFCKIKLPVRFHQSKFPRFCFVFCFVLFFKTYGRRRKQKLKLHVAPLRFELDLSDYETDALPTALRRQLYRPLFNKIYQLYCKKKLSESQCLKRRWNCGLIRV